MCLCSWWCATKYMYSHIQALDNFIDWIFSPLRTNALKAKGNDGERGCTHSLKDYAARTWKPYKDQAISKGLKNIGRNQYYAMLKLAVFKRAKAEECACAQCVSKGWEGILNLGLKLLAEVDALSIWPNDSKGVRCKPSAPQTHGADLKNRLLKLWDFLRVNLGSHMSKQSHVASHCLTWLLSSRSDSRLSSSCTHRCPTADEDSLPAEYCGAYDQVCCGCGRDGTVSRGNKLSKSFYACRYCCKISCPGCIRTMWGQSEHLGESERKQRMFICRLCSSKIGCKQHSMTCAECNEVQFFKTDLRRCQQVVEGSSATPKSKKRIKLMIERLCRNIDLYIGHVARDKCQNSFWPNKLQEWARKGTYDEMLVLSDFWRIFDGTYERRINCDTGDKQSVETHCIWSVCPPLERLDAQDLLHFTPGFCSREFSYTQI